MRYILTQIKNLSLFENIVKIHRWFAMTHGGAAGATGIRQVFPCWDEPGFNATFIIIVEHRKKYSAFSNTPLLKNVYVKDDIEQTHFLITPAIPAYHITIVLCNLFNINKFTNGNLNSRHEIVHYLTFASHVIKTVTIYFNDEWNQIIEFTQHFAVPNFTAHNDIAKRGFVFYR